MMKTQVIAIAAALGGALASPVAVGELLRRQLPCADVASYFKLVNTALFAVNYVNSFSHPCDTSLIPYFDSQGLNGRYAVDIICLYDAGVQLFDEPLDVVNDNLIVTLIGLFDAFGSITDPSRNLSCANVNVNVLEELELDSAVIKNIICDSTPCTTGSNSTSSSVIGSTSSCATGSASTVPPSRSASSSGPPGSSVSGTGSISSSRPPCTATPSGSGNSSIGSRSSSNASASTSNASGSGSSTTISSSTGSITRSVDSSTSSGSSGSITAPPSTSSIPVYPPPQTYY